jgi:hypothetical protein
MSISFSATSTLASIPADRLDTAVGGANTTLPNGEPNGVLIGGPAPVQFPTPAPITQDAAMARFNDTQRMKQWVEQSNILVDLDKAGWFKLGSKF